MNELPKHLAKYVVEQQYDRYTSVDQACWRYILRQLKAFLSEHAHESYIEGLTATGVEIEQIPRIENISKKLEKFGWRALPVSGFIPPAAFMEMQSLGVLPIASDMRSLAHLSYTPAPDIVHEAAGHAPILSNPEFSAYLKQYAQVAKKAIISKEDLDVYDAIRTLSDIKEDPASKPDQIQKAQVQLNQTSKNVTHVSEASLLSRMNWWTAEYGLIGNLKKPKIFGAGLLSSVGESRLCISSQVKKIPLTIDCIKFNYDITEPQPQLFVTPDFSNLAKVLDQMANQMAFRTGGLTGIKKAIESQTVNTVELNSGVQISGRFNTVLTSEKSQEPIYIRSEGPSQLSHKDHEFPGHSRMDHAHGFGTPIGNFEAYPNVCPSLLSAEDFKKMGLELKSNVQIKFTSGVIVEGVLNSFLRSGGKTLVISFSDCQVTYGDAVLFEPSWGTFDMAVGSSVSSVFGGPADRLAYGDTQDFVAAKVPAKVYTKGQKSLQLDYASIRRLREQKIQGAELSQSISQIMSKYASRANSEWLFLLECYELLLNRNGDPTLAKQVLDKLQLLAETQPAYKSFIEDGLALAKQL